MPDLSVREWLYTGTIPAGGKAVERTWAGEMI